ncbi:hypothetical protein ABZR86_17570 [Dyella marensis]|uniref:hypothetical protein n=1 Tax=Dyella TaxID=231454 RepID=UPI001160464F|nr:MULTISPECIES: hypothetical protein [Dyella]
MKACVVYISAMKGEAESLEAQLKKAGAEVCKVLVDAAVAEALQNAGGAVPANVRDCMAASDVCYFLLDGNPAIVGIGEALLLAATLGKKIVAVVQGDDLPSDVDDVAHTVLVPGSPSAVAAGKEDIPSDHPARKGRKREIDRVRCQ